MAWLRAVSIAAIALYGACGAATAALAVRPPATVDQVLTAEQIQDHYAAATGGGD